jgi:hypothetical protein
MRNNMRGFAWVTLLIMPACSGGDLLISPTRFDFGDVNVQDERPPEGYSARDLVLNNRGGRDLDIRFVGLDQEHLFIAAPIFVVDSPPTLPTLAGEDRTIVTVAPWNYELGELTTEIAGSFQVEARGVTPVTITWSFTPIRQQVEDTASP